MKIILAGDDLGELNFDELDLRQLFAIKAASGLTLKGLIDGLEQMDPSALQALVWHLKAQRGEHVPIESINFKIADFATDSTTEEAQLEAAKPGNETSSETSETDISEHSQTSSGSDLATLTL